MSVEVQNKSSVGLSNTVLEALKLPQKTSFADFISNIDPKDNILSIAAMTCLGEYLVSRGYAVHPKEPD